MQNPRDESGYQRPQFGLEPDERKGWKVALASGLALVLATVAIKCYKDNYSTRPAQEQRKEYVQPNQKDITYKIPSSLLEIPSSQPSKN